MKFRKKPVVIDAVEWTGANVDEVLGFILAQGSARREGEHAIAIDTLEGTMTAQRGDWIIRGVKGEFYPCKPDIFAATYEPVDPGARPAAPSVGAQDDDRVTTFTPLMWASMTDEQCYEEYVRVRNLLTSSSSSLAAGGAQAICALIAEWRGRRRYLVDHAHHEPAAVEHAYVYNRCANELEALLQAPAPAVPIPQQDDPPGETPLDPDIVQVVPPFQHPGYVIRRAKPKPIRDDDEAGETPQGWQPIETAPKDGTPIRLKWDGTTVEAIGYWNTGKNLRYTEPNWRDTKGDDLLLMPTHWIAAPPDPSGATKEDR